MAAVVTPDYRLTAEALRDYLRFFNTKSRQMFRITLTKENGQGYNLVLHEGGASPKIRIALVSNPVDPMCGAGSTWDVRDIIEELFAENQKFAELTTQTVDRALQGSLGSVMLVIEKGVVVASHFHNGELWP